MEMLSILTLLFAVMLAVERPKEGFGGLMPISDTEIMAQHLNGLSDDELSSGTRMLNELKALIEQEKRIRAVIPLKEHNQRWMEKNGEFYQQLKDAVDAHLALRRNIGLSDYDVNRDRYGDLEIEGADDETDGHLAMLSESYEDIMKKASWLRNRGSRYAIKHFMKTGEKKYWPTDYKKMLGIKGDTTSCEICYENAFYQSDYEASWQEMPGAPVQPAYYYYSCACCGISTSKTGSQSENICGVDMVGQPLYANMTTEEVARMSDEYGY